MNTTKNLFFILDTLEKYEISPYLDGGTLLGIVRNNDFIVGDKDIDLGILLTVKLETKLSRLFVELSQLGFEIKRKSNGSQIIITKAKTLTTDSMGFDIWLLKKAQSFYYHYGWQGVFIFPEEHLNTLDTVVFANRNINVPHKPEKYLELLYGKDWKIPQQMKKPEGFFNYIPLK
jgi:phosphorylcholine metabolism protein LicD